jgi:hypothetical protein
MNFAISWILSLFKKPEVEITFDKADIKAWPFPVPEDKKPAAKKKVAAKKPAAKKPAAKKVAKKRPAAKKAK